MTKNTYKKEEKDEKTKTKPRLQHYTTTIGAQPTWSSVMYMRELFSFHTEQESESVRRGTNTAEVARDLLMQF